MKVTRHVPLDATAFTSMALVCALWGVLVLSEPFTPAFGACALLVAAGIALVNLRR